MTPQDRTDQEDRIDQDDRADQTADQEDDGQTRQRRRTKKSKTGTAAWATAVVRSQFRELTGRELENVTGVDKGDDSIWNVAVEVVEMRMVPDSTDVLAQYDVEVDEDGDIVGYRRKRRYLRGRADD